jgi:hypothetical protein
VIIISLLLIFAAVAMLAVGLSGHVDALLVGSILASMLSAIVLIAGLRRAAAARLATADGPADLDLTAGLRPATVVGAARAGGASAGGASAGRVSAGGRSAGRVSAGGGSAGQRAAAGARATGSPTPARAGSAAGTGAGATTRRRTSGTGPAADEVGPTGASGSADPGGPTTPGIAPVDGETELAATGAPREPAIPGQVRPAIDLNAPSGRSGVDVDDGYPDDRYPDGDLGGGDLGGDDLGGDDLGGDDLGGDDLGGDYEDDDFADDDPPGEPPAQLVSAADVARVARLAATVLVVDGRPRYHLAGCPHLAGRSTEPLPVREAVELGFTPCGRCEPVTALISGTPPA